MTRPLSPRRVASTLALLVTGTLLLGMPGRPRLPVGAVDTAAVTSFVADGLRLLLTVGVWYLLVATALAAASMVPGLGVIIRPAARRITDVGMGVMLRRVLAGSAVVGVSLPGAAGAGTTAAADEPPIMTPVDEASDGERRGAPSAGSAESARDATGAGASTDRAPDADPPLDGPAATSSADRAESTAGGRTPEPARPHHLTSEAPVMERTAPPRTDDPAAGSGAGSSAAPVMDRQRAVESAPEETDALGAATDPPSRPATSVPRGATAPARHVVQDGESFWSIATELVDAATPGETVAIGEITPVWQRLVDRNADILVEPGNPDLLHPGQVVDLRGLGPDMPR